MDVLLCFIGSLLVTCFSIKKSIAKILFLDIKANGFNLDIKNPNVAAEDYKDPETLLKKYREAEAEAEEARNALKFSLMASLDGEEM